MKSEAINNRARAKQLLAFDDLTWGKLRPTDLDLSMDFKGKVWIFGELKSGTAGLTVGQRIHLEHLVRAMKKAGLTAFAFLANHDTPDTEHDVHVAEAMVARSYNGDSWEEFSTITVKEYMNAIYEMARAEGTI